LFFITVRLEQNQEIKNESGGLVSCQLAKRDCGFEGPYFKRANKKMRRAGILMCQLVARLVPYLSWSYLQKILHKN